MSFHEFLFVMRIIYHLIEEGEGLALCTLTSFPKARKSIVNAFCVVS